MKAFLSSKFIIISFLALTIFACQTPNPKMQELDLLIDRLEHLQDQFLELDLDEIELAYKSSGALNKVLGSYFQTLDKPSLKVYVDLSNLEKAHKKSKINLPEFEKQLKHSWEQVLILQRDIENGKISELDATKYLADEAVVLSKLETIMEESKPRLDEYMKRYDDLLPKAEHLVDSIKNVKS
jgi:hypothetical protein